MPNTADPDIEWFELSYKSDIMPLTTWKDTDSEKHGTGCTRGSGKWPWHGIGGDWRARETRCKFRCN
jgi:hypothetical protein